MLLHGTRFLRISRGHHGFILYNKHFPKWQRIIGDWKCPEGAGGETFNTTIKAEEDAFTAYVHDFRKQLRKQLHLGKHTARPDNGTSHGLTLATLLTIYMLRDEQSTRLALSMPALACLLRTWLWLQDILPYNEGCVYRKRVVSLSTNSVHIERNKQQVKKHLSFPTYKTFLFVFFRK